MISFNVEDIKLLATLVSLYSGGGSGVREIGLIDSACSTIFQTFGGQELYPSIEEKGAKLGYLLICNHAFLDGNKRVGLLAMLTFFKINNVNLNYSDKELIELGLGVASGNLAYEQVLNWVISHKI